MYKEEKMINGVLHWRNAPDAEYTAYTPEQLSQMLYQTRIEVMQLRSVVKNPAV